MATTSHGRNRRARPSPAQVIARRCSPHQSFWNLSTPPPPATIPTLELSTEPRESFHSIRYTYTPKNLLRHYAEQDRHLNFVSPPEIRMLICTDPSTINFNTSLAYCLSILGAFSEYCESSVTPLTNMPLPPPDPIPQTGQLWGVWPTWLPAAGGWPRLK